MYLAFALLILFCTVPSSADENDHKYHNFDPIPLWVNKVGPFRNPQETYEYYSLPFCRPEKWTEKDETLGEALSGFELVESRMKIKFKEDLDRTPLCPIGLTAKDVDAFSRAVRSQYWFEFFFDDLPIWGWIGEVGEEDNMVYVYTTYDFTMKYNKDQVIEVKIDEGEPEPVLLGKILEFSYSVKWEPTSEHFEERFDKYLDNQFFEHQIHWFSIFNSCMIVVFLVTVVAMILMRTLKKDFAKFNKDIDDLEDPAFAVGDESGWKQVSGDVYRQPPYLALFSALIGAGTQLMVLVLCLVSLSLMFYHKHPFYRHGTIVTTFVALYAVTAFVGGYVSGDYYKKNNGKDWVSAMVLTASVFPVTIFAVSLSLNFIAISYDSLAHIPFGTMVAVVLLWLFVAFPLTLCGTVAGRHMGAKANRKSTPYVTPYPKAIPHKRPLQSLWLHILCGGILPFGSIWVEMYFVFTAFWQSKYYYVFGFLLLVYLILLIVTVCSTIISTYFLLNSEDYRWQWVSFASSASTALYVYLYAIYYFFYRTKMTGFFQTMFYFGYMGMFCFGLALLTGAVGFLGSRLFVKRIFNYIHVD
eukprot:TRINITY_DN4500_c0_g1_i1.p1 TRINITY_DN4500_c0_g1~~TRINITY_DN4500_c0_g1_i1.p1  ORF type:complete len:597 (+),score=104.70 TRINITY_DN4500_c0_g1_i1:40-1791(+)